MGGCCLELYHERELIALRFWVLAPDGKCVHMRARPRETFLGSAEDLFLVINHLIAQKIASRRDFEIFESEVEACSRAVLGRACSRLTFREDFHNARYLYERSGWQMMTDGGNWHDYGLMFTQPDDSTYRRARRKYGGN